MTITTYTDLGLRLQAEVVDLKAQLRDTKLSFETYCNGAVIVHQRLTGEIKELKAKLAEVSMTAVPNPRVIEIYDTCDQHPDAPHGYLRDASHNAGRYICECEFWTPGEES